jgi:hypothetical protein
VVKIVGLFFVQIGYIDDTFAPYRLDVELFFCAGQVVLSEAIFTLEQMQLGIHRVCYHQFIEAFECLLLLMGLPIQFNISRRLALLVVCRNNDDEISVTNMIDAVIVLSIGHLRLQSHDRSAFFIREHRSPSRPVVYDSVDNPLRKMRPCHGKRRSIDR